MTKREYLAQPHVAERITSDSEAEVFWDAYRGSANLLSWTWDLFKKRGVGYGSV